MKTVVNKGNAYNAGGANGPSYSAYITYSNDVETAVAILVSKLKWYNFIVIMALVVEKEWDKVIFEKNCPIFNLSKIKKVEKNRKYKFFRGTLKEKI